MYSHKHSYYKNNKYNFTCVHLKVGNDFDDCVLDYLQLYKCSGSKLDTSNTIYFIGKKKLIVNH